MIVQPPMRLQCPLARRTDLQHIMPPAPDILDTFTTNKDLSETQLEYCRHILDDGGKDANDIANEIRASRAHLERLEEELGAFQQALDPYRRIVHSPRRLNNDVLMEIFAFACQTPDSSEFVQHSLDVNQPNWRLGQVCRTWRDLMTEEMPFLWTNVTLFVDSQHAGRSHLLAQVLQRSRDRLLDVSLFFGSVWANSAYLPLLRRFSTTSNRWKSLHIEGWVHSVQSWNVRPLIDNLANLQSFDQKLTSLSPISDSWAMEPFNTAPKLTKLRTVGWTSHGNINWSQITSFTWSHKTAGKQTVTYDNLPEILRACPNLKECIVDCVYNPNATPAPLVKPVDLPDLELLDLQTIIYPNALPLYSQNPTSITELERLLSILSCPSLSSLIIRGTMRNEKALANFIERSQCTISTLQIPPLDIESTRHVLSLTPSLTCLRVSDTMQHFDTTIVTDLTSVLKACERLVSWLGTIEYDSAISASTEEEFRGEGANDLIMALESRRGLSMQVDYRRGFQTLGSGLQTLKIRSGNLYPAELASNERMKTLVEGGLEFGVELTQLQLESDVL